MLILKSVPAFFFYSKSKIKIGIVNLLGFNFLNLTMVEALENIDNLLANNNNKNNNNSIFFVNPDCINLSYMDTEYKEILLENEITFPDGIGVNIACKLLNTPLKENINGTDMFPYICRLAEEKRYRIFLLGAKKGVAVKLEKNLKEKYPNLEISGSHHGYFQWNSKEETEIIEEINNSKTDILLVAFGAPYQEKWISKNLDKLDSTINIGVGGLFDFFSGNIKRAPTWMREIGIEWIYRLLKEPVRMWKRYIIGNPLFLFRVFRFKMMK